MISPRSVDRPAPLAPRPVSDQVLEKDTVGFRSSGPSPTPAGRPTTLHAVGLGAVGRAFLTRHVPQGCRVVGLSDSTGTAVRREGFVPARAAEQKLAAPVAAWPGAESIPTALAVTLVSADIVVDATESALDRAEADAARVDAALSAGASVALAAKASLVRGAHRWFCGDGALRVGCNAALGGTGARLAAERAELRARCRGIVAVPNATTTHILDVVERGGTVADGLEQARAAGLLEHDPRQDLDGTDAAIKGAVAGALLWGQPLDPHARAPFDVRHLDVAQIRARAARGETTRLVVRVDARGVRVGLEALPIGSPLAIPSDRVAYAYELDDALRVHVGLGVGPDGTAAALAEDVRVLASVRAGEVGR